MQPLIVKILRSDDELLVVCLLGLSTIALFVIGTLLHMAAVQALGLRRTYYGAELGKEESKPINEFPYNFFRHPMELGAVLQLCGLYFVFPDFSQSHPYIILGHIVLSIFTAMVEHFEIHFKDYFFTAAKSEFHDAKKRKTIDKLRDWSLLHFKANLREQCSMHRYVTTLPNEAKEKIDVVRYAEEVMQCVRNAFPSSRIIPMPQTDEIYISRYNFDRGGDQGLFDKHHDGSLRFMPGASVVRSLIYLSSEDKLEVVFDTSGSRENMKTYDFGLLDFHKELHWVDGTYDPEKPPRILLKCNYYIDHFGFAPYRWLGIVLNVAIFFVVKMAMEYSKSHKTILQKIVGLLCNIFRRLNNLNPVAPVILILFVVVLSMRLFLAS